jgi:hypothetical protein
MHPPPASKNQAASPMRTHGAASSPSPGGLVNAVVAGAQADCFDAARGKADVKWRTDELMALLRGSASQNNNREIASDDF